MRRLLPSTLAGRIILVLLVGLMAFHVGSLWLHQTGSDILLGSTQQRVTAERVAAAARAVGMVPPDTREAVALTKLFRKWMQHAQFTQGDAVLHPVHARWLFGLLACLDDDVSGEDMASLRVLARACIKCLVRARQQSTQHEGGAWMILVVLAGVCGQRDLWDEAQARLGPGGGGPA